MRKLLLSLVAIVFTTSLFAKDISVGYVLVGPSNDGGWSMRHSDGFKSLVKHGYEVEGVESVPEADSERVFKKLARKHDIVFATSFGYMEPMVRASAKNKKTIFMHATGYKGNDILFTTTDSPSVVTLAEKLDGVWSMGNDAPMGQFGPNSYITGMMFNWNLLYKHIVDQLAEGKLKMGQRWAWGLDKNCVGLSPWGKNVPGEVVNKVETVKMDWVNDKMGTYYPFDQGVTKQDGSKIKAGVLARPELETMQFFVKGVTSKFPVK